MLRSNVPQKTRDSYMAVRALMRVCIVDHLTEHQLTERKR